MTWADTKALIFSEGQTCQVWRKDLERECGSDGIDADHAIFGGRQKRKRVPKLVRTWLNSEYNAQRACDDCNRWLRSADRIEAIEHHVKRELDRTPDEFRQWFFNPPEGVSTKKGSDWQVKSIIVERCLK